MRPIDSLSRRGLLLSLGAGGALAGGGTKPALALDREARVFQGIDTAVRRGATQLAFFLNLTKRYPTVGTLPLLKKHAEH